MNSTQATKNRKELMKKLKLKQAGPGDLTKQAKKVLKSNSKLGVAVKGLI